MDKIKNKLSQEKIVFLENLEMYLDTKLYFYGSIYRIDYIDGVSDIDVGIFTNNMERTLLHLQQFLIIDKKEIKKFYLKTRNNKIMDGYKIMFKNKIIKLEISIYDEQYKNIVLNDFFMVIYIPQIYSYILIFLKFLRLFIPYPYNKIKRSIINSYKGEPDTYFFITLKGDTKK